MRDLHHSNEYKISIESQAITATTEGTIVDTAGYDGVEMIVNAGDFAFDGSNNVAVKIQVGDESNGSDMADVSNADLLLGNNIVIDNAADKQSVFKQGYIGTKRYVRAVFTITGTVNAPMSAIFQLRPIHMPAAEQDAVNA